MKPYKRRYLKYIGAGEQSLVLCENPACRMPAHHIHHIEEKGIGGRSGADEINNLVALCGDCHHIAHLNDGRLTKPMLKEIARKRIEYHEKAPAQCRGF